MPAAHAGASPRAEGFAASNGIRQKSISSRVHSGILLARNVSSRALSCTTILPLRRPAVGSGSQESAVAQRPLQCGLHLHVAELSDGEVEMLDGRRALVREVVQQQF